MTDGLVLVAAGAGERLGDRQPKALVRLADRPLIAHALDRVAAAGLLRVVVVHPAGHEDEFRDACATHADVVLVEGGAARSDSVRAGLSALPADVTRAAVHDAARAFTPPSVVQAVLDAVRGDVIAAAPALRIADTVKRVRDVEVVATVDRQDLVTVQTPQVFPRVILEQAVAVGGATDDLALVERLRDAGEVTGRIVTVPGSPLAFKITYPQDLRIAEAMLAQEAATPGSGVGP